VPEALTANQGAQRPKPGQLDHRHSADFIEADGTLVQRLTGTGVAWTTIRLQETFSKPGEASVVVRCTNEQGHSSGAQLKIQIE
jgi:hypothetical protein